MRNSTFLRCRDFFLVEPVFQIYYSRSGSFEHAAPLVAMTEFVYILENSSMPGLLKIGRTDRSVAERVEELSAHTGVPTGFTVVKEYPVLDSMEAERVVHERLADYRVSENREFFRLESEDAVAIIDSLFAQVAPKPRDFEREDELVANAIPVIAKIGVARPSMLQEALDISYKEALFVIQILRGRGVLGEQNELKASVPRETSPVPEQPAAPSGAQLGFYQLPSFDLLRPSPKFSHPDNVREQLMATARRVQQTLAKLDIEVSVGDITMGAAVTSYRLHLAPGVVVEQVQNHAKEIAAVLKSEPVRITIPRDAANAVDVEVPNTNRIKIALRDVLVTEAWCNSPGMLPLALGHDLYGRPVVTDLAALPHLWIAGASGSGKTVCANTIVAALLFRFSPDQMRFLMIDPSGVELQLYVSLPHLVLPVVTDFAKAALALRWAASEVEKRFLLFGRVGVNNIGTYNTCHKPTAQPRTKPSVLDLPGGIDEEVVYPTENLNFPEKLSNIVILISGLETLLASKNPEITQSLDYLARNARPSGVHLVLISDRPTQNVVPDALSAEIPSRIALRCESRGAARSFLGESGAECLTGAGDMLFVENRGSSPLRLQGAYISDIEIIRVLDFIYRQAKPSFLPDLCQQLGPSAPIDEDEEFIQQCIETVRTEQLATPALLQRRFRLGYTRAARILDELENRGIVGPSKGAEPRDVLVGRETGQI